MVSNLVEKAFSAKFEIEPETHIEEVYSSKTESVNLVSEEFQKSVEIVKSPRQALRIKRAKKTTRSAKKPPNSQLSIKAASQSNVTIPNIQEVTSISSKRLAIDNQLKQRSSKIDSALENMLTNTDNGKSNELTQALNQNKDKVIQDIPMGKMSAKLPQVSPATSDARVISSSNIAGNDASKRRPRESASRVQSTVDIEKNYRKWSTEYDSKTPSDDYDYTESYGSEGDS